MRRHAIRAALALTLIGAPAAVFAQPAAQEGEIAESQRAPETRDEKLERLYGELAAADPGDAKAIVEQIQGLWAKSGSDSMDLLLARAKKAMVEEEFAKARTHLAALLRLKPDFAEAWNTSATLRYMQEEYARAVTEIEHALALEPRHFSAMMGLALILEHTGRKESAMKAWRKVEEMYPTFDKAQEAIERLSPEVDGRDL